MSESSFPYANREEAKEYALKVLSDLTPGGSEFFESPVACAHYIRKTRDDLQETLKREVLRRKKIRRETIEECAKKLKERASYCIQSAIDCCNKFGEGYDPDSVGSYVMEANAMDAMAVKISALAEDQP